MVICCSFSPSYHFIILTLHDSVFNWILTLSTDAVRAVLPSIIPPSYKGATIRYLYYIKSTLSVRWLILENGHSSEESVKDLTEVVGFT